MSATSSILSTLKHYGIRPTPIRRSVLAVFYQAPCALSNNELEDQLPAGTDRITLYRTLRTFEEKALIHRIVDYCETIRYALCVAPNTTEKTDHVHLKCVACQRIFCLHQVAVPPIPSAAHYQVVRADYLLSGVCPQCQPHDSAT